MRARLVAWADHARATWFPDRQIFVRCNGVVRYFVLSRRRQWQAAAAIAGLAVCLTGGTAVILVDWLTSNPDKRLEAAVAEARREAAEAATHLRQRLSALDDERSALAAELAAARDRTASLQQDARQDRELADRLRREARDRAGRATALSERLAAANARIERLRTELTSALGAGNADRAELARARQALTENRAGRNAAETRLAEMKREHRAAQAKARSLQVAAEARADAAVARVAALRDELARMQAAAADAQARAATALARAEEAERRAAVAAELGDAAASEAAQLRTGLDDLNDRLRRSLGEDLPPENASHTLAALRRSVSDVLVERSRALDKAAGLARRLDAVKSELATEQRSRTDVEADLLDTRRRLAATLVERDKARRDGRAALGRLYDLRTELDGSAKRRRDLQATLADSQALVEKLEAERDRAGMQAKHYRTRVGQLEGRLAELLRQQADLVSEIEDRALATIDGLEETVYATGLNLEELLRRMDEELGIGGPYIGIPAPAPGDAGLERIGYALAGPAVGFSSALDRLDGRLARWKVLHMALERVPLTPPVDHFYVSSNFGKRKDPFTGKWGMHAGIDMAGPRNSEVRATAPGTVTHAGWMGQYGRMVEIDHGFGLTTRYGHLRKITVELGQTVAFRDKIGIMGSTGRSTSRHVHYEVRFDGQPVDPAKFIEAGRHVFKN